MLNYFYRARNKKGFTLIELIIVIAILAILALIAIPAYQQYRTTSEVAADAATCKIVFDAALMVAASGGTVTAGPPNAAVTALIDPGTVLTPQAGGAAFNITIDANGNPTLVTNGGAGATLAQYP